MPVSAQRSVSILACETRQPLHTENFFIYRGRGGGGRNEVGVANEGIEGGR